MNNTNIFNAIKSMYKAILIVDGIDLSYEIFDLDKELLELATEPKKFDIFCESLGTHLHPEDRCVFEEFSNPAYFPKGLENEIHVSIECRLRQADQRYYWIKITFCHAEQEDSTAHGKYLFMIEDIDNWKTKELLLEAEERAAYEVLREKYDSLFEENMIDQQTGCYNRKGMNYYIDMITREILESDKHLFVCVADLSGLKYLNDTYGHEVGDQAISTVAAALLKGAPVGSKIVRTGGDEFLMFAALDPDSKEPEKMGPIIDAELEKYNKEHPAPYSFGVSYGWILGPMSDGGDEIEKYTAIADKRMYEMKIIRDSHRR